MLIVGSDAIRIVELKKKLSEKFKMKGDQNNKVMYSHKYDLERKRVDQVSDIFGRKKIIIFRKIVGSILYVQQIIQGLTFVL